MNLLVCTRSPVSPFRALGSGLRAWPLFAQEAAEESLKSLMITTDDEGDGGVEDVEDDGDYEDDKDDEERVDDDCHKAQNHDDMDDYTDGPDSGHQLRITCLNPYQLANPDLAITLLEGFRV